MSIPSHFDLVSAEKAIRADLQRVIAEALRMASTDDDRALVRLQAGLEDLTVAFALWDMGRMNNGGDREDPAAAEALGYVLGNMIASFVRNSGGHPGIFNGLMDTLGQTAVNRLIGNDEEDAVFSSVSIEAAQGGNA